MVVSVLVVFSVGTAAALFLFFGPFSPFTAAVSDDEDPRERITRYLIDPNRSSVTIGDATGAAAYPGR